MLPPGAGVTLPPGHAPPPGWTMTAPGMALPMPGGLAMVTAQMPPQMSMTLPSPMQSLGPPPAAPAPSGATVCIAIDCLPFRYQLSEADVKDTFQRWGSVQSVQVLRDGPREVGVVQFADQVDAGDAQRQLTGQNCSFEGSSGTLAVVLGSPDQLKTPPRPPVQTGPAPGMGAPMGPPPSSTMPAIGAPPPQAPPAQGSPIGASGTVTLAKNGSVPVAPAKGDGKGAAMPASAPPRPAWCCKIVVEAESLHPEFPTVLRIVGEGGANVEHIRTQTKCNVVLRGKGSGTNEPETNQELPEPMFLWLTSDNAENGKSALEMTQDLLKSIYEGHQQWCDQNKIMHPSFIKPQITENPEVIPSAATSGAAAPAAPAAAAPAAAAPAAAPQVVAPPASGGLGGYGPCGGKGGFPGKGSGPYSFK
eukprot:gb/GFBE01068932.1/.p1 GENE.gb/GFBE01068932.1/~~gb/GFBE01068932.1/.p1  ORF type:complete len:419 (+),score=77.52 gb/GFBE01068932.1/:1-1257(+)